MFLDNLHRSALLLQLIPQLSNQLGYDHQFLQERLVSASIQPHIQQSKYNRNDSFWRLLTKYNEVCVFKRESSFSHMCCEYAMTDRFTLTTQEIGVGFLFRVKLFHRSVEHTSELQSPNDLVCRLL